jgi:CheY-like chemotaxis protein
MARRVLVVDDHLAFRRLAMRLLTAEGLEVIGEAATGNAAVAQAAALRPDIVLLDVRLPDIDGFAVAERLATLPTPPAVVLTSSLAAADFGGRLVTSRACGFLDKRQLSAARLEELSDLSD